METIEFQGYPQTEREAALVKYIEQMESSRSPGCSAEDAQDAKRYRWLRSRDLNTIDQGGVFAGKTPKNVVLNGDDLDKAIDEAMSR